MFFRKNGKRALGQKRTQVVSRAVVCEDLESRRHNSVTAVEGYPGYFEVTGTQYNDTIEVSIAPNRDMYVNGSFAASGVYHALVVGGAGHDTILTITTGDTGVSVDAGSGDDSVSSEGDTSVWGGPGNDIIYVKDSFRAEVYGEAGYDYLSVSGTCYDAYLSGGDDNDTLDASGNDGKVVLLGGAGDDEIYDSHFNDYINGGSGLNMLYHVGGDFDDKHNVYEC